MSLKKWNFVIDGFSGMHYYCIAETFDEALKKARQHAEELKKTQSLEEVPDILSLDADTGDYVE